MNRPIDAPKRTKENSLGGANPFISFERPKLGPSPSPKLYEISASKIAYAK